MKPIAQSFEEKLCAKFPQARELAIERLFTGPIIFFDSHKHRPKFGKAEIFAALLIARRYAYQSGEKLHLSADEKKLWRKHFELS
jgi:hypothetical protein